MIGSFTASGSTSNTQPIANEGGKFLLNNENSSRFHAEWMMDISGSISRIAKYLHLLRIFLPLPGYKTEYECGLGCLHSYNSSHL